MKEGRKLEYPEKTPGDELQKMPHTTARRFSLKRDSNPHDRVGGRLGKQACYPLRHVSPLEINGSGFNPLNVMNSSHPCKLSTSHCVQIQTLILYGVEDIRLGIKSMENLKMLPNSHIAAIPYAGHASFKEQPGLFHRALYHFLTALKASL